MVYTLVKWDCEYEFRPDDVDDVDDGTTFGSERLKGRHLPRE